MSFYTQGMLVITAFFLVSVWVKSLINIVEALFLSPRFDFCCKQVTVLWWRFVKENGKWRCYTDQFALVFQYVTCVDIEKPVSEDIDKKEKAYVALSKAITLCISLLILVLCREMVFSFVRWDCSSAVEWFLAPFAIGMVWHSVVDVFIALYVHLVVMKRLGGYVDSLIKRLRQGDSYESMNLKPLEELPYEKPTSMEKNMYYQFYIPYLISVGKTEEMKKPIKEMTDYFLPREYILQETLNYYWLLYYYSRYEENTYYADIFYRKISSTLEKDTDANGKRVLAYYYYGIKKDVEKARRYVEEGMAVIEKFGLPGAERELERKLLMELDEMITAKVLRP